MDSRLRLGHRIVPAPEFSAIKRDCDNGISLYNRPELDDIQVHIGAQQALSRLQEKDKDLGQFLQHLDGKLNLILRNMGTGHPSLLDGLLLQRVNIGGSGIAFWSREQHRPGDIVELHLLMPGDNAYINCFGKVVKCGQEGAGNGQGEFRVAMEYVLIMESDRELLIQYNFKQQSLALQRRRMEKER